MQATRLSSGRVVANAKAAENASRLRAAFGLPRIQRRSLAKCSAQQLVSTRCPASDLMDELMLSYQLRHQNSNSGQRMARAGLVGDLRTRERATHARMSA